MNILSIMNKMADKLVKHNNSFESQSKEMQEKYLRKIKEPKNDFERSYAQYLCQMKLNGRIITFFINMASLPLVFFYFFKKQSDIGKQDYLCDAIFFADGKPENIVPKSLRKNYAKWITIKEKREYLTNEDKIFVKELLKTYPFSWHFLLKCLIKIRFYSYVIYKYCPSAIITCSEYSFTSSVLTEYCQRKNIKHINVMHGEKLYYIRDSFFRFHSCYVWNEYYSNLFQELRAEKTQFITEIPESMSFEYVKIERKSVDYTYYLGSEKGHVLALIVKYMNELAQRGRKVAIRPHPRYTDLDELRTKCNDIEIEDYKKITIEESVLRTEYAISLYSTVLNQAYRNGTKIAIDNMSNPSLYNKLKEFKYIMLDTEHDTLSDILEKEWKGE